MWAAGWEVVGVFVPGDEHDKRNDANNDTHARTLKVPLFISSPHNLILQSAARSAYSALGNVCHGAQIGVQCDQKPLLLEFKVPSVQYLVKS